MPKRVYTRAYASFRIYGEHLDPLEVTKALLLPYTRAHRNGEPHLGRLRHNGEVQVFTPFNHGHWSMSSKKWVKSPKLETHLCWLLNQLEPRAREIQKLLDAGYKSDFFCFSEGRSAAPPSISNHTKERSEALGINIEIDHYDSSEYEQSS